MSFAENVNIKSINGPVSAFGDILAVEPTPQVQLTFPYNINTDLVAVTEVTGGTVTQADSMAVLQTGTNSTGAATLDSVKIIKYRNGSGSVVRFTALFTTGIANSTQIIGVGDDEDGFFFGYNGATFGVMRRRNSSDTWTAQSSWSEDTMDGSGPSGMTLDQTKLNVLEVQYQWLGSGQIIFKVENPDTGMFVDVHKIKYANSNTVPSVYNPSFPMHLSVVNSGNLTNLTLKTASLAGFVEGKDISNGSINSFAADSTHSAEAELFSIKNRDTHGGKTNRVSVLLKAFTTGNDVNQIATFRIYQNATLTSPTFVDVDATNSVVQTDVTASGFTGGKLLYSGVSPKDNGVQFDVEPLRLEVRPGDTFTVTSESSGTGLMSASFTWLEDF